MSKMDDLRAMREAKYAANAARGARQPVRPRATPPVAPPSAPPSAPVEKAEQPTEEGLCGHRNMSGRTCTREAGHAAKSHRYS